MRGGDAELVAVSLLSIGSIQTPVGAHIGRLKAPRLRGRRGHVRSGAGDADGVGGFFLARVKGRRQARCGRQRQRSPGNQKHTASYVRLSAGARPKRGIGDRKCVVARLPPTASWRAALG
jgi:hypothetical protein